MSFAERYVIFDTNTLVSAMLRPASVPRQALLKGLAEARLVGSDATLGELDAVIQREKFDDYLTRDARLAFSALVRRHARLIAVSPDEEAGLARRCRDPRDDKFLALAKVSGASVLVSGDADLLSLTPYGGLSIMTPGEFVALGDW